LPDNLDGDLTSPRVACARDNVPTTVHDRPKTTQRRHPKTKRNPPRHSQRFTEGIFPASEPRRSCSKHPVLPGTGREQRGGLALDASRPWYGAVACEALSAAAFSSLAEEASSQAYLSGIRPGARPRFHTRLTPVFYA